MTSNFLTKEGFEKLQDELDYLRKVKRQEVAERLHEAMEGGELIENAEYEAAKNEQAFVEGRIQELDVLLASAKIIDEKGKKRSDGVQLGFKVTIKEGNFDPETFTLVHSEVLGIHSDSAQMKTERRLKLSRIWRWEIQLPD